MQQKQQESSLFLIATGFLLPPASITQAEGVVATFLCQYPQAIGLNWIVNGTGLSQLPLPGLLDSSIPLYDDRTNSSIITETLNVTAYARYNDTKVRCFATLLNGTRYWTELSSTATLTVQGLSLKHCHRTGFISCSSHYIVYLLADVLHIYHI